MSGHSKNVSSDLFTLGCACLFSVFFAFLLLGISQQVRAETIEWISDVNGSWHQASNWSLNRIPTSADDVIINRSAANVTVSIIDANAEAKSLHCTEALSIAARSLSLNGTSVVSADFSLSQGASFIAQGDNNIINVTGKASIDNGRFFISGGAKVNIPQATTYDVTGLHSYTALNPIVSVIGAGSELNLSSVTKIRTGFPYDWGLHLYEARDGGVVDFSGVTTIENAGRSDYVSRFETSGGGKILFPNVASIPDSSTGTIEFNFPGVVQPLPSLKAATGLQLTAASGVTVTFPELTKLTRANITIQAGGVINAPNLVSIPNTVLTIVGSGVFNSGMLTDITNARFFLSGGAVYDKVAATTYDVMGLRLQYAPNQIVSVIGAGSRLDLSSLEVMQVGYPYDWGYQLFEALDFGILDLSYVTLIENKGASNFVVRFQAGSGGKILLQSLQSVTGIAQTIFDIGNQADNNPPKLSEPTIDNTVLTNGRLVTGPVTLKVKAIDVSGVSKVDFIVAHADGSHETKFATDTNGGPYFSTIWNPAQLGDGNYKLIFRAYDTLLNKAALEFSIVVDVAPPPAPSITSPSHNSFTGSESIVVSGTAQVGSNVKIYRGNTLIASSIAPNASGVFNAPITLLAGENILKATATGPGGTSPESNQVTVTLDKTIPDAPRNVVAQSVTGGEVKIYWSAPSNNQVLTYNVYRSISAFSSTGQATRVNQNPLTTTTFYDLPENDGTYYYRVEAINQARIAGPLSEQVVGKSDRTPPKASLSFESTGTVIGGVYGPGIVTVTLIASEELLTTPFLSITPKQGTPMTIQLTKRSSTTYKGDFTLHGSVQSGTAYAVFSGYDVVGNRGTQLTAGSTIVIDTQGPVIEALTMTPSAPLENNATTPLPVHVRITLDEPPLQGTKPTLQFTLSKKGTTQYDTGILTEVGSNRTQWEVTFTLPADAGLPDPENLKFNFNAKDAFENIGNRLNVLNTYQVFQGNLPPLPVPTGLTAKAKPGGKVELTWNAVEDAAGYQLYRKGPDAPQSEPLTVYGDSLKAVTFVDTTTTDGAYSYAVASIREINALRVLSAQSPPVEVRADSKPPQAPQSLSLSISGQGILANWEAPQGETTQSISYSLYRANLRPGESITTSGLTPIKTGIRQLSALDASPSQNDHAYAVTAVDNAGNESAPSNTYYLNFGLLPVSELNIEMNNGNSPKIKWRHASSAISKYIVSYVSPQGITQLYEGTQTDYTDTSYPGGERTYSVVAFDENNAPSIPRSIFIPNLSTTLPENLIISRGVFNKVLCTVSNTSAQSLSNIQLKGILKSNIHYSDVFSLAGGETKVVPIIIGGYKDLAPSDRLSLVTMLVPSPGESVSLSRIYPYTLNSAALQFTLDSDQMRLGGTGKIKFTLTNTSAVSTEIITARNTGALASDEVRLKLIDAANNTHAVQPVKIYLGQGIMTLPSGDTVLRLAPGETYTSPWLDFDIPSATPLQARMVLEVDKFHTALGTPQAVHITGHGTATDVTLIETPYFGKIDSISPEATYGVKDITIRGKAISRLSQQPEPFQPLDLVIRVRGFERKYQVNTDAQGAFEYVFSPISTESGQYDVSLLYPGSFERPVQGQFVINGLILTPAQATSQIPRNYEYTHTLTVKAATTGTVSNVRIAYVAEDQNGGTLPAGIQVSLPSPVSLASGETKEFPIKIVSNNTASNTGMIRFRALSDATGTTPFAKSTLTYELTESSSDPRFSQAVLSFGVKANATQTATTSLKNHGFAPLLDAQLQLINNTDTNAAPSWIYLVTPSKIANLDIGQSLSITIAANPGATVSEGHHRFRLRLTAEGKLPVDLPVDVAVSQSGEGSVLVHLSDIYTATLDANGVPIAGLANARVTLQHEELPEVHYEGTTNTNGEIRFDALVPGSYYLRGAAPGHNDNYKRIVIQPGVISSEELFLMNTLVTIEWSVNEISLEDRYEISLEALFETDVPFPVLVMEPVSIQLPNLKKGEVFYGELRLTNYGLIRGTALTQNFPTSDQKARYEFLTTLPETIEAHQSITIPYRITALEDMNPGEDGGGSGGGNCNYEQLACVRALARCANGAEVPTSACTHWFNSRSCSSPPTFGTSGGGPIGTGWVPEGRTLPKLPKCAPGFSCHAAARGPQS